MEQGKEPKYVQQIGMREERARIYIEDYVNTFIKQPKGSEASLSFGLLLGEGGRHEGRMAYYLSGAVEMEGQKKEGRAELAPESFQAARKEKAGYFGSMEIWGWYYQEKPWDNVDFSSLEKLHFSYFNREGQLFCVIPQEGEARFYYGTKNRLILLEGYFIYYERNSAMQNYLVDHTGKRKTEPAKGFLKETQKEPAVERFRAVMKENQERHRRKRGYSRTAMAAAAAILCGALLWRSGAFSGDQIVEALGAVQEGIGELSFPWEQGQKEDSILVQEIPGNVYPTQEPQTQAQTEPQTQAQTEPPAETEEEAKEPETYTVKKGDSLKGICRQIYGDEEKLEEIISLNGITDPNLLKEGQILKLP